jgi:hypothetical protein
MAADNHNDAIGIAAKVSLAVLTLMLTLGLCVPRGNNNAPSASPLETLRAEVQATGESTLRKCLKYPDNAKFQGDTKAQQDENDGNLWAASGKVEALNGFGAKPIVPWECVLRIAGTPGNYTFKVARVRLDKEVLYQDRAVFKSP